MKAYIINFIFCLLFSLISEYYNKKNNKKMTIFFLILSLIVPCFIAGVRYEYVGRDVHNYLTKIYSDFRIGNSLFKEYSLVGIEPLFLLITFIGSKFSDIHAVFFIVELFIALPIYIYAYKKRNEYSMTLIIFIFLSTMYCYSLSMMRQSISIAISLLTINYFYNNNYKKGFITLIIAFLFHHTAIITFSMYVLVKIVLLNNKNRSFYLFLLLVFTVIMALLTPYIISFLPIKYSIYLDSKYESSVNILSIIKKIIWLLPISACLSITKDKTHTDYKLLLVSLYLCLFDIIFYLIGLRIPTISRISLYFNNVSYFIFVPILIKKIRPRIISETFLIIILLFLWHHMTIGNNQADIYPYKSDIFTFLN